MATHAGGFGIGRVHCADTLERHLEDFGQVQGVAIRALGDLFAATETIGDDEPVCGSVADGRQEFEFADGDGDVVFVGFEAEGAGHAATSRSRAGEVDAQAAQDGLLGGHLHNGFLVAVAVQERFAMELGQRKIFGVGFEKFAEKKSLARKGLSALVVGKEVDEFVPKDGDATGFEANKGDAGFDLGRKFVEDLQQERLGAVEHAVVVEGASAAEAGAGNDDAEACGFEDFNRGFGGVGVEIIVEGVGPEENWRGAL